jgi:hypothetical protein
MAKEQNGGNHTRAPFRLPHPADDFLSALTGAPSSPFARSSFRHHHSGRLRFLARPGERAEWMSLY